MWFALLLIPLCALLNHLGGQSTTIPDPRFFCRMLGQGIAFGAVSWLCGIPYQSALELGAIGIAGFVIWAVWKWGPGFMAITGFDSRGTDVFSRLTSALYPLPVVASSAQCKLWGMIYMTLRGMCLYPLFIALTFLLTPWAMVIGIGCLLQGIVYRMSSQVLFAEWKFGSVIGATLAAVLITHFS